MGNTGRNMPSSSNVHRVKSGNIGETAGSLDWIILNGPF